MNQVKTFDRDLRLAGIPKRDERGRVACVHSLRHSFATLMSRAGVAPRIAQAAMRHSSIDLTMNVYTDPRLLDVNAALAVLPELSLEAVPTTRVQEPEAAANRVGR
jgi:integrase